MVRNSPYQIVLREFTVLTVLQRLHGDFPETLQRHHRDSTETLRRYYRDSTEILHGLYRDSAETPHRLCRDSIETPQKLHRDSAETPEILQRLQRFYRDSLETLTESCNGSTTKLLGSVAGIFFHVSGPWTKIAGNGPKWGRELFFLLIQTLPTFWATQILILRTLFFGFFGSQISRLPGSQISRFPDRGLGRPAHRSATPPRSSATPPDHKVGEIQGTRTIP